MPLLLSVVLALAAAAASSAALASSHARRSTLTAGASSYGRILFDGRGFALYAFTRDPRGKSVCTGACAKAWPPYVVKTRPRAAAGVKARLLGTTRRADGTVQVTYAGRALYYYVGDRKPREVLCQNVPEFGGIWRMVGPSGTLAPPRR
jgi:predicted lipoprotein with Yx(FWY)xxD motif